MSIRKPNFFVIGAMKAGTSSFHQLIGRHPDVFMSDFKEPQYFAPHKLPFRGWWGEGKQLPSPGPQWYLDLFREAGSAKWLGESSTAYTKRPLVEGCVERIHRFNPDARLIYVVRDPVDRAVSHYWHFVRYGSETRDMLPAFRHRPQYTQISDYAMQLEPYVKAFGRDRICIVRFEDVKEDASSCMRSVWQWLGIDEDVNVGTLPRENPGAYELWRIRGIFRPFLKFRFHWRYKRLVQAMPDRLRETCRSLCSKRVLRKEYDEADARAFMREQLRARTEQFCTEFAVSAEGWAEVLPPSLRRD
ncbi:MAG: sulfotransferase family protein [Planctomycetota bacterium]